VRFGAGDAVQGKNGEMLKEVAKSNGNSGFGYAVWLERYSEFEN